MQKVILGFLLLIGSCIAVELGQVPSAVTIDGDNGGTMTLVSGATVNDSITLIRDLDINRLIEYQNNGDLLAETLNEDQNYQTYLID